MSTAGARRAYARLLRLYPTAHREQFGAQMLDAFADHYRDVVVAGGGDQWAFWLGVLTDTASSLMVEHAAELRRRPGQWWYPAMAAAGGVLLWLILALKPQAFTTLLIVGGIVLAMLGTVARLLCTMPMPARPLRWAPAGLGAAALLWVYQLVAAVPWSLLPTLDQGVGGLPTFVLSAPVLLATVVGMVVAYRAGTWPAGAGAAALMCLLGTVTGPLTRILVIATLWQPLRAGTIHSALSVDYGQWMRQGVARPTLVGFLHFELLLGDGIALLVSSALILAIQAMCAAPGAALGVALRRLGPRSADRAVPPRRVGFVITMTMLSLAAWASETTLRTLGPNGAWTPIAAVLTNAEGLAYLVGLTAVGTFVLATVRRAKA